MQDHPIIRKFVELPWYVKLPALIAGFLMNAAASQFPAEFQLLAYYCGIGLALWVIAGSVWHWTLNWKTLDRSCITVGAVIGVVATWHALQRPPQSVQVSSAQQARTAQPPAQILPKTLETLFQTDFRQFLKVQKTIDVTLLNGQKIQMRIAIPEDIEANSMFLMAYIPRSPHTFLICVSLSGEAEKIVKDLSSEAEVRYKWPGESSQKTSKTLKFSGRVYAYHEDELSPRQLVDLTDFFLSKGLLVQFRSEEYVGESFRNELLRSQK